jgi:2-methylaconitate cis-trans-isomerase PrpF
MVPTIVKEGEEVKVPGVAVQRTARRIMEGTIYVRR